MPPAILPEVRRSGGAELGLSTRRTAHFDDDASPRRKSGRLPTTGAPQGQKQGQHQQVNDALERHASREVSFPRLDSARAYKIMTVPSTPLGMLGLTQDEYHEALKVRTGRNSKI
jgi:hypothetical protein